VWRYADIVPAVGDAAHHNVVLRKEHMLQPTLQCENLFKQLDDLLGGRGPKIDAVISASGGFAMGNAQDPNLLASCEAMFSSSTFSSFVAVHTAATFGKPRIITVLPGAAAVASPDGTPWGLAYGSSKSGVSLPHPSSPLARKTQSRQSAQIDFFEQLRLMISKKRWRHSLRISLRIPSPCQTSTSLHEHNRALIEQP
jgi:hypothetical protein